MILYKQVSKFTLQKLFETVHRILVVSYKWTQLNQDHIGLHFYHEPLKMLFILSISKKKKCKSCSCVAKKVNGRQLTIPELIIQCLFYKSIVSIALNSNLLVCSYPTHTETETQKSHKNPTYLTHLFPLHPFQGVEKRCIGDEWVNASGSHNYNPKSI